MQCGAPRAWIAVVVEGDSIKTKLFLSAAAPGPAERSSECVADVESSSGLPLFGQTREADLRLAGLCCDETATRPPRRMTIQRSSKRRAMSGDECGMIPSLGLLLATALRIPTPLLCGRYRHPACDRKGASSVPPQSLHAGCGPAKLVACLCASQLHSHGVHL